MIMMFVLIPISHYNTITETYAWFLYCLLECLSTDFPSQLILSILDTDLDTVNHEKLVFPTTITHILTHFGVNFPSTGHFHVMGTLGKGTISRSSSQLIAKAKRPREDETQPSRRRLSSMMLRMLPTHLDHHLHLLLLE